MPVYPISKPGVLVWDFSIKKLFSLIEATFFSESIFLITPEPGVRQVFLAMLWLSTSAFASLLPHASAVMTHLICDSSRTLCHFLYSYSCYQVVAGRFTRWGDDPSRWLCSPPLFSLSIHSFLCFYLYWSIFMLVFVTLFYVPHSYLCLFIFIWLSVILLSGFALIS